MPIENLIPESPAPAAGAYAASADTLLQIFYSQVDSPFEEPPMLYQARNLTQTLEVIDKAMQQERTINGVLTDVSNPAFRKYSSKITCTDINAPPLDDVWPGMTVTVWCTAYLCYPTGRVGSPARPEVSGSQYTLGHFTFYRPILTMLVGPLNEGFEEWRSDFTWSLSLEEV
jgi:hypothetical protein